MTECRISYPRSDDEETRTKSVWLKGHTGWCFLTFFNSGLAPFIHTILDIGSVTILWSQPVAGLQIPSPDGKWRWVRHIDNALVINAGDAMELLSGGLYKATIHRVVQPPADQRGYERLGAFYFAMADDDVVLKPLTESPVLQRVGIMRRVPDESAPTMEKWRLGRTGAFGQEGERIGGVVVSQYN